MRKLLLTLAAVLMLGGATATRATDAKAPPPITTELTTEQRQKNLESFDLAWKTVRDSHYDPKLGGVDWPKVRDELRPRLEKAKSMDDARRVMQEMLDRLGNSHLGILAAEQYEDLRDHEAGEDERDPEAEPGFDVRMADGEVLVVRVSEGRPAAKAGVRPGWRVRKIDGEDVAPTLARVREHVKKSPGVECRQACTVQSWLRGVEGKSVAITFLDGSGQETTLSIPRAQPLGHAVRQCGLPSVHVHFEARTMDNTISYFYLSEFLDPMRVMPAFGDAVRKNLKADGFILDLRGNPGGMGAMVVGMGGWFVDRPGQKLGTFIYRKGAADHRLNPREETYQGPLAILVDDLSACASEILAGGLQDLKRARVFGTRTVGACQRSPILRLPNGDRLQFVIADYVSAGGERLEGNGVRPDEVVPVDRQALLDGHDPVLEAAVKWIRSHRGRKAQQ
jgi:carboxyl-terminal processing protease